MTAEPKEGKKKKRPLLPSCSLPSWALALPYPRPLTPFPSLSGTSLLALSALHQQPRRLENLMAVVGTWFIHRRRREKQGFLFQPVSSSSPFSSSHCSLWKRLCQAFPDAPQALWCRGRYGNKGRGCHPKHHRQVQHNYLFHEIAEIETTQGRHCISLPNASQWFNMRKMLANISGLCFQDPEGVTEVTDKA